MGWLQGAADSAQWIPAWIRRWCVQRMGQSSFDNRLHMGPDCSVPLQQHQPASLDGRCESETPVRCVRLNERMVLGDVTSVPERSASHHLHAGYRKSITPRHDRCRRAATISASDGESRAIHSTEGLDLRMHGVVPCLIASAGRVLAYSHYLYVCSDVLFDPV